MHRGLVEKIAEFYLHLEETRKVSIDLSHYVSLHFRMLHLIKEKAKPVTPTKKRKKYNVLSTLEEYKRSNSGSRT